METSPGQFVEIFPDRGCPDRDCTGRIGGCQKWWGVPKWEGDARIGGGECQNGRGYCENPGCILFSRNRLHLIMQKSNIRSTFTIRLP